MMKSSYLRLLLLVSGARAIAACSGLEGVAKEPRADAPDAAGKLFTLLPSSYTGVRFENRLTDTRELNVFTYRNYYNGGGVAIGDLSGDGLPEIVLTSNLDGNRLYLNRGEFRFSDVTKAAGVAGKGFWRTGVTLADVNDDGRLDIYVCYAGNVPNRRANELYINDGPNGEGVPTFTERAREYGIADEGFATHAAFFDYDRDGDLDLYVLNNSSRPVNSFGMQNTRNVRNALGGDKLFRNDGARFVDVSARAGIFGSEIAFGLGVAVGDVNRDGWPDLYISNDFFERDYLYINNGNGTFTESLERQMPYISHFSMGLDIADINNDAWPDVYVTDMLPEDDHRLKTTSNFEGWDIYQARLKNDYYHQFMRNMLHLNNGNGSFSDVGQLAGVARTDWSWSALIADYDLDGQKDIYVTNGLARDVTSQDYVAFLASEQTMLSATKGNRVDFKKLIDAMSSTKLPDYAFRNHGKLRFSNESASWGLDRPSFSNGAAYGDLDGDGALDLVVNNVNDEAFVYRNNARSVATTNRYLQVKLEGDGKNRFAIGARVTVRGGADQLWFQELVPSRGFQSSVDYVLTFGVGAVDTVASVTIDWPDGRISTVERVATNQRLSLRQYDATRPAPATTPRTAALFANISAEVALPYAHRENDFVDFERERLIPKLLSTEGPYMTVADVNGDGLDDAFIGGARDQLGAILIQQRDGRFASTNAGVFEADRVSEDLGAVFFDANGDRHPDLYVVSGGNEFSELSPALQDRLYVNDGRGNFRKTEGQLPPENNSGSRVVAADYDGDGDVDLFVGARVVPWRYGTDPRSALLRNDGKGRFTDVTEQLAPELSRVGMVTDALWQDSDRDGRLDLIVVGEWMPITVLHNAGGGRLQRRETRGLESSHGWWNRIVAGDFNRDGRTDFIVGNLGLNGRLQASVSKPATMVVKDFDRNGWVEQIISHYTDSVSYPMVLRDDLLKALPYLQSRFPSYRDYAGKTVADIFGAEQLKDAVAKKAHTFATSLMRSNPDGSYTLLPLAPEAQIAPAYGLLAGDFDRDGNLDLLLAGNFDGLKPEMGRMSAGQGLFLRGDGRGNLTPVRAAESGFVVPGQARDIQRLRMAGLGDATVVTRNNDRPLVYRANRREGR